MGNGSTFVERRRELGRLVWLNVRQHWRLRIYSNFNKRSALSLDICRPFFLYTPFVLYFKITRKARKLVRRCQATKPTSTPSVKSIKV
jgi:hypothetical protein